MIRQFNKQDFLTIYGWWVEQKEVPPTLDMLPEDSTFVLTVNNKPFACLSLYLTNCKEICYLENFVADPLYREDDRNLHINGLIKYVEKFAKQMGYKRLVCLAYKDKLKIRYQEFGYKNTLNNLSSFSKELV